MKNKGFMVVLVAILCLLVGFGLGRTFSPMERGIRRAQRMTHLGTVEQRR